MKSSTQGVSPVVAVILMVAVTVILSAVIGTFVLNLGQQTASDSGTNDLGLSTTVSNGTFEVTVITGSTDKLELLVDGNTTKTLTNVSPGDTASIQVNPGQTVSAVSITDGERTVVLSTTVDKTTNTTVSYVQPFKSSLVAHYPFDSGSGTTADDVVGGYDGSLINGTNWTTVNGETVANFDGTDDGVIASNDSTLNPTNITVSVWVYHDDATKHWMVIDKGDTQSGTYYLYDDKNSNYGARWTVKDASGNRHDTNYSAVSDLKNNTWYHLVGTYDNGSNVMRLYVNGTEVDSTSGVVKAGSNSKPLRLGDFEGGGYHLDGKIRDARIYNRVLNSNEISKLYNKTKP